MNFIQVSKNYKQFKFIDVNRKISMSRVKRFIESESFKENYKKFPILVDKDYGIIDGQHRFKACEILELPIYFIRDESLKDDDILTPNSKSKRWSLSDFTRFHLAKGVRAYEFFREHENKYNLSPGLISLFWSYYQKEDLLDSEGKRRQPITEWQIKYKEGKLTLKNIGAINESIADILDPIVELVAIHGKSVKAILYHRLVIQGLIELREEEREAFNRVIAALKFNFAHLARGRNLEEQKGFLKKISRVRGNYNQ